MKLTLVARFKNNSKLCIDFPDQGLLLNQEWLRQAIVKLKGNIDLEELSNIHVTSREVNTVSRQGKVADLDAVLWMPQDIRGFHAVRLEQAESFDEFFAKLLTEVSLVNRPASERPKRKRKDSEDLETTQDEKNAKYLRARAKRDLAQQAAGKPPMSAFRPPISDKELLDREHTSRTRASAYSQSLDAMTESQWEAIREARKKTGLK